MREESHLPVPRPRAFMRCEARPARLTIEGYKMLDKGWCRACAPVIYPNPGNSSPLGTRKAHSVC